MRRHYIQVGQGKEKTSINTFTRQNTTIYRQKINYLECFQWANILGQKTKEQLNGKIASPKIVTGYKVLMEKEPKRMDPRLEWLEILLGHSRVLNVKLRNIYLTHKQRRIMGSFWNFYLHDKNNTVVYSGRAMKKTIKGKDWREDVTRN